MNEKTTEKERRKAARREKARKWIATYIEDLFLLCGGVCFVTAAGIRFGAAGGFAAAGACLTAYAVVIARAKRGGGRK